MPRRYRAPLFKKGVNRVKFFNIENTATIECRKHTTW